MRVPSLIDWLSWLLNQHRIQSVYIQSSSRFSHRYHDFLLFKASKVQFSRFRIYKNVLLTPNLEKIKSFHFLYVFFLFFFQKTILQNNIFSGFTIIYLFYFFVRMYLHIQTCTPKWSIKLKTKNKDSKQDSHNPL